MFRMTHLRTAQAAAFAASAAPDPLDEWPARPEDGVTDRTGAAGGGAIAIGGEPLSDAVELVSARRTSEADLWSDSLRARTRRRGVARRPAGLDS